MLKTIYLYLNKELFPKEIVSFSLVIVLLNFPGFSLAAEDVDETQLSGDYSMTLDVTAISQTRDAEYEDIRNFFHKAEMAIESEDLPALMALYSVNYKNRRQLDKEFAEGVWRRIFANFDKLSSRHNMQLITHEEASGQAVTQCSGLLTGIPKGSSIPVTIDSWDDQRHILVKEGTWKLFGNAGESAIRYGEDEIEIHPLF